MAIFTVLPSKSDSNAADAMPILRGLIAEPVSVVYLIVGKPRGIERILEVGIGRAEAFPGTRRVVWAPDPQVLDAPLLKEIQEALPGAAKVVAVVFGLEDTITVGLRSGDAKRRTLVELAFAVGEQQGEDEEDEEDET